MMRMEKSKSLDEPDFDRKFDRMETLAVAIVIGVFLLAASIIIVGLYLAVKQLG